MPTYLAQEPGDQISEDNCLIGFMIGIRRWDARGIPQIALPLVEPPIARASIDEQHPGSSLNEPATVDDFNATRLHGIDGLAHGWVRRSQFLHLYRGRRFVERPDQCISLAIFGGGDGRFGLEDRVDAADTVGHFSGHLKQHVIADIALDGFVVFGHD